MERGDRQEAREPREVPDQSFGTNLLAKIEPDVALEHGAPFLGGLDQGNGSGFEGNIEVEVVAELDRSQWMHGLVQRAAGEQVYAHRLELTRARPEQGKLEPAILNMAVHFVEEIGKTLNLVDHHPAARRHGLEIRSEKGWIGEVVLVACLVQEIDAQRIGKLLSRPGALADPADAEEKETLPGWSDQSWIGLYCHIVVNFLRIMTTYYQSGIGESMKGHRRRFRQAILDPTLVRSDRCPSRSGMP